MNENLIFLLPLIPTAIVLFLSLWKGTNKLFNMRDNPLLTLFGTYDIENFNENEVVCMIILNIITVYIFGMLIVILWFILIPLILVFFIIKLILRKYTNKNN